MDLDIKNFKFKIQQKNNHYYFYLFSILLIVKIN